MPSAHGGWRAASLRSLRSMQHATVHQMLVLVCRLAILVKRGRVLFIPKTYRELRSLFFIAREIALRSRLSPAGIASRRFVARREHRCTNQGEFDMPRALRCAVRISTAAIVPMIVSSAVWAADKASLGGQDWRDVL